MRVEYQKTFILFTIILIFSALIGSSYFDKGQMRENNTILFSLLILTCFIAFFQTQKIKQWDQDKKTDYSMVYSCYFYFTLFLIAYCFYIIMTRSERECIIKLNEFFQIKTKKLVGGFQEIDFDSEDNILNKGLNLYKNVWKLMLGIRD
jgi:hypothetical protein